MPAIFFVSFFFLTTVTFVSLLTAVILKAYEDSKQYETGTQKRVHNLTLAEAELFTQLWSSMVSSAAASPAIVATCRLTTNPVQDLTSSWWLNEADVVRVIAKVRQCDWFRDAAATLHQPAPALVLHSSQLPFPLGTMDNSSELSVSLRRVASMRAFSRSAHSENKSLARELLRRLPLVPDASGRLHFHAVLHALVEQASTIPPLGTSAHAIVVDASATPSFSPWRPRWGCQQRSSAGADPTARAADTLRFVTAMGPRSTLEVRTETSIATNLTATARDIRSFGGQGGALYQLTDTAAGAAIAIGLAAADEHPRDIHLDGLDDGDELSVVPEEEPSPTRGSLTSPTATAQARMSPEIPPPAPVDPVTSEPTPPLRIGTTVHRSIWDRSPVQRFASGNSTHSSAHSGLVARDSPTVLRLYTSSLKGPGTQRLRTGSGSLARGAAIQRLHTASGSLIATREGQPAAGAADRTVLNMLHSSSQSGSVSGSGHLARGGTAQRPQALSGATGGAESPSSAESPPLVTAAGPPVMHRPAALEAGAAANQSASMLRTRDVEADQTAAAGSAAPRAAGVSLRETFEQRRAAMSAISNRFLVRQRSLRMMPSPTARASHADGSIGHADSTGQSPHAGRNDSLGRAGRNDSLGRSGRNDSFGQTGRNDSLDRNGSVRHSPRFTRADSLSLSPHADFVQHAAAPVLAALGPAAQSSAFGRGAAAAPPLGLPRATRSVKGVTPRSASMVGGGGSSVSAFATSARALAVPGSASPPAVAAVATAAVTTAAAVAPAPEDIPPPSLNRSARTSEPTAAPLAAAPVPSFASPSAAVAAVPPKPPPASGAPSVGPVSSPARAVVPIVPASSSDAHNLPSTRAAELPTPATPASRLSAAHGPEAAAVLLSARARAALERVLAVSVVDSGDGADAAEDLPGSVG